MKNISKKVWKGFLFVVGVVVIGSTSAYATTNYLYDSKDVKYDNSKSGLTSTYVEGAIDELYLAAASATKEPYPVGSIYISVNNTNPSTLFGGTWVQLKDRFLLGAGDTYSNGATGGEAEHTLTIDEMPSHSHSYKIGATNSNHSGSDGYHYLAQNNNANTGSTGGDQPHNNMPPYLVVYMWKRTA